MWTITPQTKRCIRTAHQCKRRWQCLALLVCICNVKTTAFDHVQSKSVFIRPSSDGTYYGMVMSVRPSVRRTDPSVRPSAHFLHFSHTCFDIMSWNFAHDFVLMYYRSSLSVVTLRQFLYAHRDVLWYGDVRPSVRPGLRPPVFRTFLLHALTYWAEILHMTLF